MFCDRCGTSLQAVQAVCSKCGKQIAGVVSIGRLPPGRVENHVHLLAILWFALSAINLMGGLFLLILGSTLFPHLREIRGVPADVPTHFLTYLFSAFGIGVLFKALVGFIAAWGLVRRESWARMVVLVLAFIALFHIPLGTALGVYTLWALLPRQSQQQYDALVAARAMERDVRTVERAA